MDVDTRTTQDACDGISLFELQEIAALRAMITRAVAVTTQLNMAAATHVTRPSPQDTQLHGFLDH